jgi:hypothetical protein
MDLYGHLIDRNLWDAAARLGGTLGAQFETDLPTETNSGGRTRR